jgi:hypothetical protein
MKRTAGNIFVAGLFGVASGYYIFQPLLAVPKDGVDQAAPDNSEKGAEAK